MPKGSRVLASILLIMVLGVADAHAAGDRATLERYARGTWASMAAMTDPQSGLPADTLGADGSTSVQTSPTNIGAYLWSAVAAERLGIIGHDEAVERITQTLASLEQMETGDAGQYYNWYDHESGDKLTVWPPDGKPLTPILSSVDNGWLAVGLRIVQRRVPELRDRAKALFDGMDFGFYYRPDVNRVLFHYVPDTGEAVCCYDTLVSESRIVDYLGIVKGELPGKTYYGRWRTFPNTCDFSWQETRPVGQWRTYQGVDVFEGSYPYAGMRVVPSWGGSMFEALMPALFVPEETWAKRSWGINHPLTVKAQIHHGMHEAGYGAWGFSPSNIPEGGYAAYGVDGIGMDPNGYPSNEDATLTDRGFAGCPDRPAQATPPQSAFTNGVVTPHASFLALRYSRPGAVRNLERIASRYPGAYGPLGFRDSVNVDTGRVSDHYLSLDQGMVMAALGNALGGDVLRTAFAGEEERRALQPVIGPERFTARAATP